MNPTITKSFRIPGVRLPPTTKTETIATSAAPKMKVYLPPPPLNFVDVKRPTSNKNSGYSNRFEPSVKEMEDRKHVSPSSPTNFYSDAYPSPSRSSSKKVSPSFVSQSKRARNYTPPRSSRPRVRTMAPYRPPSPPTSDLPIPSDADDIQVEVDHEGIQHRYAEMKRLSRKVLCSYFVVLFCHFYVLSAYSSFFCVLCSSADARALMCGICWESTVVVMSGRMLRAVVGKVNKRKFG